MLELEPSQELFLGVGESEFLLSHIQVFISLPLAHMIPAKGVFLF